jgi:SAM-dependent methyltransferase
MIRQIRSQVEVLAWCAHYYGLAATMWRCAGIGWKSVGLDGLARYQSQQFDRRFNVSTSSVVTPAEAGISDERRDHAVQYQATQSLDFPIVLSRIGIESGEYSFVDYGSGMGRILLLASEFPFRSVHGVELSKRLHCAATENIRRFRSPRQKCTDIRSTLIDAAEFELPDGPLVLFFFNPFDDVVLAEVLDQVERSLRDNDRRIVILYYNPVHQHVTDGCSWLQPVSGLGIDENEWRVYEAVEDQVANSDACHASSEAALTAC